MSMVIFHSLISSENDAVCVVIFVVDVGILTLHSMYLFLQF